MRFVWFLFETATRCPSLQNEQSTLPLQGIGSLRKVALLGPAIDDGPVLLGDYANMDAPTVSFAAAAVDAFAPSTALAVARGCVVTACQNTSGFAAAEAAAKDADLAVLQVRALRVARRIPGCVAASCAHAAARPL